MNVRPVPLPIAASLLLAAALSAPAAAERESYSFVSDAGPEVSLLSTAADEERARVNTPVLSGDRIVTGAASRAEVVLASGNVVRIDAKSELRFDRMSRTYESDDDRDLLYLQYGDAAAEIRNPESGDRAFRLDTDDATIVVASRGSIRVDTGRRGTEVYVLAGEAEVTGRGGSAVLREGGYAFVSGTDEIEVGNADLPRDQFTRFIDERENRRAPGEAATWISSDYEYESSLADFDQNGSWVFVSSSGQMGWRPAVSSDWRPYSLGYWRWTPCGLTWVSYEPWGWLPYHFGTWRKDPTVGWLWLPGAAFAPAWVYWSYTPTWVGWCPIGYYGHGRQPRRTPAETDGGARDLPNLHGRVDLTRVDPRGWNYAPVSRIGRHLDPSRDITRGERLPLRPGDTAIISTAPLRTGRGSTAAPTAVREAVRRLAEGGRHGGAPTVNEGLTALLGRDRNLAPGAEQELRRSISPLRPGETAAPHAAEAVFSPRRLYGGFDRPGTTPRGEGPRRDAVGGDDWRTAAPKARGAPGAVSSAPARQPALDNGWRSPASPAPRDLGLRRIEPTTPNDTGWRAPRREPSVRAPDAHVAAPGRAPVPHQASPPARAAPAAPRGDQPKNR
jgi:hypothetical protein